MFPSVGDGAGRGDGAGIIRGTGGTATAMPTITDFMTAYIMGATTITQQ